MHCKHPDGCPKPAKSGGWCSMHYARVYATGDPGPVEHLVPRRTPYTIIDGVKHHTCRGCGKLKPVSDYYETNKARCKPCFSKAVKRRAPHEKHGLTAEEYGDMLIGQDFSCLICGEDFNESAPLIDHDHTCCPGIASCGSCVRGVLCGPCNTGLGMFRDDPRLLVTAAAYVEGEMGLLDQDKMFLLRRILEERYLDWSA